MLRSRHTKIPRLPFLRGDNEMEKDARGVTIERTKRRSTFSQFRVSIIAHARRSRAPSIEAREREGPEYRRACARTRAIGDIPSHRRRRHCVSNGRVQYFRHPANALAKCPKPRRGVSARVTTLVDFRRRRRIGRGTPPGNSEREIHGEHDFQ